MGRRIRTDIPQVKKQFVPNWPLVANFKVQDEKFKALQKRSYDKRHRVKQLPELPDKLPVWVENQGRQVPGEIIQREVAPRSYLVDTPAGEVRRNRSHLRIRLEDVDSADHPYPRRTIMTRSRTGTAIRPPDRLSPLS